MQAPWLLMSPPMFAEDAFLYLAYAMNHSALETLTASHQYYYHLVENVFSLIAVQFPIEYAAHVANMTNFVFIMIPASMIVFSDIPFLASFTSKIVALLTLIFTPAYYELHLDVCNVHYFLCISAALLLLLDSNKFRFGKRLLLLIGGLTVPTTIFLTPFFLYKWIVKERNYNSAIQCAILVTCCVVQFAAIKAPIKEQGFERRPITSLSYIGSCATAKLYACPIAPQKNFVESSIIKHIHNIFTSGQKPIAPVLVAIIITSCLFWVSWQSSETAILLTSISIWMFLMSFIGHRIADGFDLSRGYRMEYIPHVLMFFALIEITKVGKFKFLAAMWLSLFMLIGAFNCVENHLYYRAPFFFGPSWESEVKEWRKNTEYKLNIRPIGSTATLPNP